jgi:hypothetical protein
VAASNSACILADGLIGTSEQAYDAPDLRPDHGGTHGRRQPRVDQIDNNLHWQLDLPFGEDASRIRERNPAHNFAWLRRIALSLLKQHERTMSIRGKRKGAALDTDFLEEIACTSTKLGNG